MYVLALSQYTPGCKQDPNGIGMKTTRYFDEQVMRKRPYIEWHWCMDVIAAPLQREAQPNGRILKEVQ